MSQAAKLSIALTPELTSLVNDAVESGEYATVSEVVREALREWKRRRVLSVHERRTLQALWAEGVASGPGRLGDISAIKTEARRRFGEEYPTKRG